MILLETSAESSITWRTYLQDANQIAQIVGTIMVVIYVIYTYLTFRQIKKQTDYQQDAYLKTDLLILKDLSENTPYQIQPGKYVPLKRAISTKYLNLELSTKITSILKPIFKFEDNLFEGNYFTVIFTNYGNAEVNKIIIKVNVTVYNSKDLIEKKMLRENESQEIKVIIDEIVERNGGKLKIPILTTAAFPIYNISVFGEYFDVRSKKYLIRSETLQGQNTHFQSLPE